MWKKAYPLKFLTIGNAFCIFFHYYALYSFVQSQIHNLPKTVTTKLPMNQRFIYAKMRYLKLNSYGMTLMNCERGSPFPLPRHLIASFRSSLGNWRHIQSRNDPKSFAKSSRYQSKSFGIPSNFIFVEIPTAACKYSFFATSSSFSTSDAVYTLTFNQQTSPINNSNIMFVSINN